MVGRGRFGGTASDLAHVICPFVDRDGVSWIRYSEEEEVKKAKLDKEACAKHGDVAAACKQEQDNMSFKKDTVEGCMGIIVREKQEEWKFSEEDANDWQSTVTRSLRNMLSCIHKAEI